MTNKTFSNNADLVCFSHLRWNFVFQRPQHLMSRFARGRRVFFFEEAIFEKREKPTLRVEVCSKSGVNVCTPMLPEGMESKKALAATKRMANRMFRVKAIGEHVRWFYTPMALDYSPDGSALAVIYDCMDELSLFRHAPPSLQMNEKQLFSSCDLVFTGGISLFEAKRRQHDRVYPFPSSVDMSHFLKARTLPDDMPEQMNLARPRLGYSGVIDERFDLALLRGMAEKRPHWQFIMLGPVVKINPDSLPRLSNIHWLGPRNYAELPQYLAGWDIALMPFALNDATRFISPTKTPEYLAAGLPVISTAVRDVVRQYGETGMAYIAVDAEAFVRAAEEILLRGTSLKKRHQIDAFLGAQSWDQTWASMDQLISAAIASKTKLPDKIPPVSVVEAAKSLTATQAGGSYV